MALYFAYGSNLDRNQMVERCRSAKDIGVALLPDYRIAFTRYSSKRNGGVADVVPEKNSSVWGGLYEISEDDLTNLNSCEGYDPKREGSKNSYNQAEVFVYIGGDLKKTVKTLIYVAVKQKEFIQPHTDYLAQIIRGAKSWGLTEGYIEELQNFSDVQH